MINWRQQRQNDADDMFFACCEHVSMETAMRLSLTVPVLSHRFFKVQAKDQPQTEQREVPGDWRAYRWMESDELFRCCCKVTMIGEADADVLRTFLPKMAARTAKVSFCVETVASVFRMQGHEAAALALEMAEV